MPPSQSDTFDVGVDGGCLLTAAMVWPDGNAPENPTEADVCERIRAYADRHGVLNTIKDWNLPVTINVNGTTAVWTP